MVFSRRWSLVLGFLFAPCALLGFLFAQPATTPKKVALLVGINKYVKRNFPDLDYAERDVETLASELQKLGFQTKVLTGSAEDERRATRKNIENQLQELLRGITREDIVLVVLSGHGIQIKLTRDGQEKEDAFFCPVDAEKPIEPVKQEPETLFSISYLIDDLLASKGGKNLVVIDACRDSPKDPNRGVRGVQGRVMTLPEETAVLFSCRAGQQSYENNGAGGGHGVFTYCFLEGLRGEAANKGEITWAGLVRHVEDMMQSEQVLQLLGNRSSQQPIATGNVGRTVLGRVATRAVSTEPDKERSRPREREAGRLELKDLAITNSIGMKLAYITPGSFKMGSPADEKERRNDEEQHEVEITRPFYLGVFQVTQGQYARVMDSNPSYFTREKGGGLNHPVEHVSWIDAVEFCKKLSDLPEEKTAGRVYRLPTEAEWEYACRADTQTPFCFGNSLSSLQANFDGNYPYGGAKKGEYLEKTAPVGSYKPNDFGLFDMHGNLWQWCADWYDADYYKNSPKQDPQGPSSGQSRVMRGGCWNSDGWWLRSAHRGKNMPGSREDGFGFRVALSMPSTNR
jgi:formylglycine-generating enzyme required for sulfatase activity